MVTNSRTPARADELRPLNRPLPIQVETEQGLPVAITGSGHRQYAIVEIQDTWRIDDEWWRKPVHRRYYRVQLDNGSLRTMYVDGEVWYEQRY